MLTSGRESDGEAIAASLIEPERFSTIFDRHFSGVHRYLARRASVALADEVAASTFAVAFESRRRFRTESACARPWLLGIATNLLRERIRAERREYDTGLRMLPTLAPAADGEADGRIDALVAALAALDPDQRDVLLLYAWEELSYEEISHALEIPIGTVRSRLARARHQVRDLVERENHELEEPT
jgi:RNA polymerase sigma-70 factor (ECF subfamily)